MSTGCLRSPQFANVVPRTDVTLRVSRAGRVDIVGHNVTVALTQQLGPITSARSHLDYWSARGQHPDGPLVRYGPSVLEGELTPLRTKGESQPQVAEDLTWPLQRRGATIEL